MNKNHKLSCKHCHYEVELQEENGFSYSPETLLTGADFRGNNEPLLYELVPSARMKNEIAYLLETGATLGNYHDSLYVCPHCSHLSNHFFFQLESDAVYEPAYKCDHCLSPLEKVKAKQKENSFDREVALVGDEEKIHDWNCPSCHSSVLCQTH